MNNTELEKNTPEALSQEEQTTEKKANRSKTINRVINILLVVVIALAAVCTFVSFVSSSGNGVPNILGVQLLSIQTDSMYPELKAGDLAIDGPVKDASKLRPGEIITYWTVIDGERVLNTHRIVNIFDGGDYLIFETKGDNNTSVDPLTVHESEIIGKYKFHIGGLGKAFDYLQTPTGFFLVVLLPVLLFFIFNLVQFFRALFEYQGVKNRIKFEQERGATEELIAQQMQETAKLEADRAKIEAELREKLRAEILENMAKENAAKEENAAPDNAEEK
ncbi:MAG: signal peptidase I [Clostridia bacterium]|nr:signal peptidase I [Clostridia bacterium]MBR6565003.1 signal peptidase I [Clostridia bacterium]